MSTFLSKRPVVAPAALLSLGFLALAAQPAAAQNLVTNGSFEAPAITGNFTTYSAGSTAITGWTVGGDSVDLINQLWVSQNGSQSVDMDGNNPGSLSQTITTVPGQQYLVSFYIAANTAGAPTVKSLQATFSSATYNTTFNDTGFSNANMGWSPRSFLATATGTSTVLTLASTDGSGNTGPAIDNVSVTAAPEPGAFALSASAFAPVLGFALRRRFRANR